MWRMPNTRLQSMTKKQLALIIDYMETHEEMCAGKLTSTFTKPVKNAMWEDLSIRLNAIASTDSRECVKSVAKWQRTWIDWRSSLRKKARYLKREAARGAKVKPLSPLEQRALQLFRKVDAEVSQDESDFENLDKTSQSESSVEGLNEGISVKIENVISVPESDTTSAAVTLTKISESCATSTSPIEVSTADTVTTTAVNGTFRVAIKEEFSNKFNNYIFVPVNSTPLFSIKDNSPTVINTGSGSQKETPNITTESLQINDIPSGIERSTTAGPSTSSAFPGLKSKGISQTAKVLPEKRTRESLDEDLETSEPPRKRRTEDTLGGLPLTLQNSILERLDTLNRNIETNTCALTILAKAINDSAETRMRTVNHLAKAISSVGNLLSNSLELLKTDKVESQQ